MTDSVLPHFARRQHPILGKATMRCLRLSGAPSRASANCAGPVSCYVRTTPQAARPRRPARPRASAAPRVSMRSSLRPPLLRTQGFSPSAFDFQGNHPDMSQLLTHYLGSSPDAQRQTRPAIMHKHYMQACSHCSQCWRYAFKTCDCTLDRISSTRYQRAAHFMEDRRIRPCRIVGYSSFCKRGIHAYSGIWNMVLFRQQGTFNCNVGAGPSWLQ